MAGKSLFNGGFDRKITEWSSFQHAIFDYRRVNSETWQHKGVTLLLNSLRPIILRSPILTIKTGSVADMWPGDQGRMLDPVYNLDTVPEDAFVFGAELSSKR